MRWLLLLVSLLLATLLGYVSYEIRPQVRQWTVTKPVYEQRVKQVTYTVTRDGREERITVPVAYVTCSMVSNTVSVSPTIRQKLASWVAAGAAGILFLIGIAALVLWTRAHWTRKAPPKSVETVLLAFVTTAGGLIGGLLLAPNLDVPQSGDTQFQTLPISAMTSSPVLPAPVPAPTVEPTAVFTPDERIPTLPGQDTPRQQPPPLPPPSSGTTGHETYSPLPPPYPQTPTSSQ